MDRGWLDVWISRYDVGDIGHKKKRDSLTSQDLIVFYILNGSEWLICHDGGDTCASFPELFGHVCDPCEDKSANLLDDELSKRTNRWDHPCNVCDDKAMTRGVVDHFRSKGHWSLGSLCMDLASQKCD